MLGLGNIGPLASKPVMEGKAVLFKKFAGIDLFDIEIDALTVDRVVDVVSALEPTFGGINLEDIKAPECFEVEARLREKMNIPVFHDDQHGTAIIVAAAVVNAMELSGKALSSIKVVASGAGAAALACLNLLVQLGVKGENVFVSDIEGVVYEGRTALMDRWKSVYAQKTEARHLSEIIVGADVFLGLSAAGVLKPEMVAAMGEKPLILALANPNPEITPEEALAVRPDAMMCTGRSDYPNQVNNVLCFPYIFRGALDVGATTINEEMKVAAARAIAALAKEEPSDVAARAYGGVSETFGPNYLIPSPFDNRLILRIAPAVARAAMETGVARRPITDFSAYLDRLHRFVFRSGLVMKPIIAAAREAQKRVIYSDGEDERVLRAAQVLLEDGLGEPILIGRPSVIEARCERYGLKIRPGKDFAVTNPEDDPRYREYVDLFLDLVGRRGVTPDAARTIVRTNATVIGALAVKARRGGRPADRPRGSLHQARARHQERARPRARRVRLCGAVAPDLQPWAAVPDRHLRPARPDAGRDRRDHDPGRLRDPPLRDRAEGGAAVRLQLRFARPAVGRQDARGARDPAPRRAGPRGRRRDARRRRVVAGDRARVMPKSTLGGEANLLVFPTLDAANIAMSLLKISTDALHVGPLLLGTAQSAHILTPS